MYKRQTYGSRIQKDDGGLTQLVQPGLGRPGYAGPHDNTGGTDYGKSQGMSPGAAQARGLGANIMGQLHLEIYTQEMLEKEGDKVMYLV